MNLHKHTTPTLDPRFQLIVEWSQSQRCRIWMGDESQDTTLVLHPCGHWRWPWDGVPCYYCETNTTPETLIAWHISDYHNVARAWHDTGRP